MASPKVTLELRVRDFKKLSDYLDGHEWQIANDEEDYGDLKELFFVVFDCPPRKSY